ncbi:MAG: hypothetical protein ACUVSF_13895 [Anaerolineae bacterium]
MTNSTRIAPETRKMWWINVVLLGAALATMLSGIYFLFFPQDSEEVAIPGMAWS